MVGKVSVKTLRVHQSITPSGMGNSGSCREMSWELSIRPTEIKAQECGQPPGHRPTWGDW